MQVNYVAQRIIAPPQVLCSLLLVTSLKGMTIHQMNLVFDLACIKNRILYTSQSPRHLKVKFEQMNSKQLQVHVSTELICLMISSMMVVVCSQLPMAVMSRCIQNPLKPFPEPEMPQ